MGSISIMIHNHHSNKKQNMVTQPGKKSMENMVTQPGKKSMERRQMEPLTEPRLEGRYDRMEKEERRIQRQ